MSFSVWSSAVALISKPCWGGCKGLYAIAKMAAFGLGKGGTVHHLLRYLTPALLIEADRCPELYHLKGNCMRSEERCDVR